MLVCNSYKFHTHTPQALLPYGAVSSEFSVDEVGYYLETKLGFEVDVVCLVNIAEDKWILRFTRDSEIDRLYRLEPILPSRLKLRRIEARMWSNALDAKDVIMSLLIEACQFDASNVVNHVVRWIVPFLRRRGCCRW